MKKIKQLFFIVAISVFSNHFVQGQNEPLCVNLINYVRENGIKKGEIKETEIYDSSWLKKVEGFSIDGNIVVIAKIYFNKNGISSKEYIFCGIPSINWDMFYGGRYQVGRSLGEKFHDDIFKYKCNCQ